MRKIMLAVLLAAVNFVQAQQKVIPIYTGAAPGSESWSWKELEGFSPIFNNKYVANVTQPTLTVFLPDKSIANGTAVVICPGGGFHVLSIESEGYETARWMNKKGITAFVLRYRLAHSLTDDPVKELIATMGNQKKFEEAVTPVIPMAIADGIQAMTYVRQHANDFGIDAKRIGLMGFSAGGTITTAVAYAYTAESRPDFLVPVYAFVGGFSKTEIANDAPPMFVVAAIDDQLVPVQHSINLFNDWITAKHSAELHVYAKGGHGFGMRKQNLPVDGWIDRFGEWLESQGLNKTKK